ncbi:hypothetical protein D7Y13_37135, partial [Corallococcus praedator]
LVTMEDPIPEDSISGMVENYTEALPKTVRVRTALLESRRWGGGGRTSWSPSTLDFGVTDYRPGEQGSCLAPVPGLPDACVPHPGRYGARHGPALSHPVR